MSAYKRRKTEVDDDDRISQLPDEILCFILSLLSMRDAVKTRLLSRRWRFLCSSSSNLHFDVLSVLGIREFFLQRSSLNNRSYGEAYLAHQSKFLTGVEQFLQCYTNPRIDTFRVSYVLRNDSASHIDKWIGFALGMQATTISLNLRNLSDDKDYYNFPCHILPPNGKSPLKNLHLTFCNLIPSPDNCKLLNSLTTLDVSYLIFNKQKHHLDNIFSCCLNLECLILNTCVLDGNFCIHGSLPRLKSLFMFDCMNFMIIELNSLEKLETFEYIGRQAEFEFINLPAMMKVHFNFTHELGRGLSYVFSELAYDLPKLESLSLQFFYLGIPVPGNVAIFKHLKQLELCGIFTAGYDLLTIVHFLNASPALQKLHIYLNYDIDNNLLGTNSRRSENGPSHLQLKEVELCGFHNDSSELELVRYLFNKCISLERMIVNVLEKHYHGVGKWQQFRRGRYGPSREEIRDLILSERLDSSVEVVVP